MEKTKVGIGAYFHRRFCNAPPVSRSFTVNTANLRCTGTVDIANLQCARQSLTFRCSGSKDDDEMLQVKSLLKGSPAQTCDKIAIGDYIIAVNGKQREREEERVGEREIEVLWMQFARADEEGQMVAGECSTECRESEMLIA